MLFQNLEIWNNEGNAFFAIRNYAFGVPLVCQLRALIKRRELEHLLLRAVELEHSSKKQKCEKSQ